MATEPTLSFSSPIRTTIANGISGIAVTDVNGDGKSDVILGGAIIAPVVSVCIGKGDGTFAPAVDYATSTAPGASAVRFGIADVNSDGHTDLVVATGLGNSVAILMGKADGTFASPVDYAIGQMVENVRAVDVNGDGKPDLITSNKEVNTVSVLINKGNGTFEPKVDYAISQPEMTTAVDVNGDGKPDLVSAHWFTSIDPAAQSGNSGVTVMLNQGNGTFGATVDYRTPFLSYPDDVVVKDLNGDGKADMVVSNVTSVGAVSVFLNKGDGTFANGVIYGENRSNFVASVADVTGDGKPDLIVGGWILPAVMVMKGNGDGTFGTGVECYTFAKYVPGTTATGDFNGDGRIDVLALDSYGGELAVLLNTGNGGRTYVGYSGNDTFTSTSFNDSFDGGTGVNTVVMTSTRTNATITTAATGLTVTSPADGTDTLTNIQRIQFSDTTVALDVNGSAGQIYRLYQAALNRTPDKAGLGDWIYSMDHDAMSLQSVAAGFMSTPEFKAMYGANPTNSELVTKFYQNVLHRAPEQAGYDYWMNQLNSHAQTATQVLAGFSESTENQAQVIGVIQNGFEYTQHV